MFTKLGESARKAGGAGRGGGGCMGTGPFGGSGAVFFWLGASAEVIQDLHKKKKRGKSIPVYRSMMAVTETSLPNKSSATRRVS
jgi:hypothetical protein